MGYEGHSADPRLLPQAVSTVAAGKGRTPTTRSCAIPAFVGRQLFLSRLRINVLCGTASAIIRLILTAIAYPIFLYHLGYEAYGLWLTLGTVLAFTHFGNVGFSPALTKLVAEEFGRNDLRNLQCYVMTSLISVGTAAAVMLFFILSFRVRLLAALNIAGDNLVLASSLLPYVGLVSVYALLVDNLTATLSGLGRFDLANHVQVGGRTVSLCVAIVLITCGTGIAGLLIADAVSLVLMHAACVSLLRGLFGLRLCPGGTWKLASFLSLLRIGGGLASTTIIGLLVVPFNRLALAKYAGLASLPIYEISYNAALAIRNIIESGMRALNPEVSRLCASQGGQPGKEVMRIYKRAQQLTLAAGIPLFATVILFAHRLLRLWLGQRFHQEMPVALQIIAVGSFFSLLGTPAVYCLIGLGRVSSVVTGHCAVAFVNGIIVAGAIVSRKVSVFTVLVATTLGMAVSTLYLFRAMLEALKQAEGGGGGSAALPRNQSVR